jgi:hypothetical protein
VDVSLISQAGLAFWHFRHQLADAALGALLDRDGVASQLRTLGAYSSRFGL